MARFLRGHFHYSAPLVDSDISAVQALASMLGDEFHVSIVAGVRDVLLAVADQPPVLVVTELGLSDGSGLDLLRTLRSPLLMVVSIRKGVDDKLAAFQAGADDYLVEPVDPALFVIEAKRLSYFAQVLLPGMRYRHSTRVHQQSNTLCYVPGQELGGGVSASDLGALDC